MSQVRIGECDTNAIRELLRRRGVFTVSRMHQTHAMLDDVDRWAGLSAFIAAHRRLLDAQQIGEVFLATPTARRSDELSNAADGHHFI